MRNLSRGSIVLAGLAATAGSVLMIVAGCSSDATGIVPDAASDGKVVHRDGSLPDARTDVAPHADAGMDVVMRGDAGRDAGHDATQDAAHDVGMAHDGGRDVATDTGHDSGFDASALLHAFPTQVDKAYCEKFAACCMDPAQFSVPKCVSIVQGNGGALANVDTAVLDSGHLDFSPSAASNCLNLIQMLDCAAITSAQQIAVVTACAAPIKGTLAIGATGCKSAWDCKQPAYCDKTGKCAAILQPLSACADTQFSQDCTSLGNVPGAFCGPFGATSPTCLTAEGDGGACQENLQCNSTFCGVNGCVSSEVFAMPGDGGTCNFFPPDGG